MSKEQVKVSHRTKKRVKETKAKARPGNFVISIWQFSKNIFLDHFSFCCCFFFSELNFKNGWTQIGYAKRFDDFTQFEDNVERIDYKEYSCQRFIDEYEAPYKPCVITVSFLIYWISFLQALPWFRYGKFKRGIYSTSQFLIIQLQLNLKNWNPVTGSFELLQSTSKTLAIYKVIICPLFRDALKVGKQIKSGHWSD